MEYVVDSVGADRLLFGTDMPLLDAAQQMAKIATSVLPIEEKKKILVLNALRLLKL